MAEQTPSGSPIPLESPLPPDVPTSSGIPGPEQEDPLLAGAEIPPDNPQLLPAPREPSLPDGGPIRRWRQYVHIVFPLVAYAIVFPTSRAILSRYGEPQPVRIVALSLLATGLSSLLSIPLSQAPNLPAQPDGSWSDDSLSLGLGLALFDVSAFHGPTKGAGIAILSTLLSYAAGWFLGPALSSLPRRFCIYWMVKSIVCSHAIWSIVVSLIIQSFTSARSSSLGFVMKILMVAFIRYVDIKALQVTVWTTTNLLRAPTGFSGRLKSFLLALATAFVVTLCFLNGVSPMEGISAAIGKTILAGSRQMVISLAPKYLYTHACYSQIPLNDPLNLQKQGICHNKYKLSSNPKHLARSLVGMQSLLEDKGVSITVSFSEESIAREWLSACLDLSSTFAGHLQPGGDYAVCASPGRFFAITGPCARKYLPRGGARIPSLMTQSEVARFLDRWYFFRYPEGRAYLLRGDWIVSFWWNAKLWRQERM